MFLSILIVLEHRIAPLSELLYFLCKKKIIIARQQAQNDFAQKKKHCSDRSWTNVIMLSRGILSSSNICPLDDIHSLGTRLSTWKPDDVLLHNWQARIDWIRTAK